MVVVSLCDHTGNMVKPWSEAGFKCYCIDLQHNGVTTKGNITFIGADITKCISTWLPANEKIGIAFGFPPCTHTAVSGSKYFRSKGPRGAAEAFTLIARVDSLLRYFQCPYMWEQPVATTSTYCGQPDHTFDPYQYAGYLQEPKHNAYTKKTCLWTGGGFVMPEPKPIAPIRVCKQGSWVQKLGGKSVETKNKRSATPMGFAIAVFEANKHCLTL